MTRRLLGLVGLLSVLLIAVVVNAALRGGDLNQVAAAAERTAAVPGARIAMTVKYSFEGESETIDGHGGGAFNSRTGRSRAFLALPISGETLTTHSVGDDHSVYLRGPTLTPTLPPGKKWTSIETLLGHFTVTAFSTNGGAETMIEALEAVDDSERLGRETVRGHPTTRYRGTFEFSSEAQVVREAGNDVLAKRFERLGEKTPGEIPIEAWIDEAGLTRKLRVVEPLPEAPDGQVLTMDMTMELFDFGAEPKIELPAPSTVLDYTPVALAELQMLNGEANADLIAATPPALPESEFRRRGLAVCAGIRAELEAVSGAATKALSGIKPGVEPSRLSPLESLATARQWSAHITGPIAHLEKRILKPLAALGPPSNLAAPYRNLLRRFAIDAEAREAQAQALQAGAFKIYTQVEQEFFTDDGPEEEALLRRAGLEGCLNAEARPSVARQRQRPSADTATSHRILGVRPTGEWVATGQVLTAKRVANRSVGEVLHRRWRFETRCTGGKCQTYLLRTSSTGIQSSPLRFLPHNYLAEFGNLETTCEAQPGYFRSFSVTFSIWWTRQHTQLVAEEMGGFDGGPRCPYAGERIRWTAHRRSPSRRSQGGLV
jgi:hypothetical protein